LLGERKNFFIEPGIGLGGAVGWLQIDSDDPDDSSTSESDATWTASQWQGKTLIDRNGERIGKLQDVYVDVETDEPQFATVKEGFLDRHLTFVPLAGVEVGPEELHVTVAKEQVRSAPDLDPHGQELSQADESALYHHFQMNYTPISTPSGRRLARR
jgi:sporulation protein YlmC with PRC-barrel domain